MYQAIVFLPLIAAIIAGFGGTQIFKHLGRDDDVYKDHGAHGHHHAHHESHHHDHHGEHHPAGPVWPLYLTSFAVCVSAVLSWVVFLQFLPEGHPTQKVDLLPWISSGALSVHWALRVDTLTAVMFVVVNTVSALVHVYSLGYMSHDEHRARFFAYLSLFTFAMLMLVTADNLVQLFFGWEGVGLASYLLIGFWYTRDSANAASIKAFVVNRVGDLGLSLGIFACFFLFQTVEFDPLFKALPSAVGKNFVILGMSFDALTVTALLLFMGAMGKSAQFLLHVWLPDAMEGPTPVSALIHAATMVTAGVFLVARLSPLYELAPHAKEFIVLIGAITAFFAATVGLVQNDIKRVIAYSTCSQLGYMFVALGLGAYGVAVFHLFTHAFFKALLFLGSGSVIHAMSGEQDMRKMGGLAKLIPKTWIMMIIGNLALTGFPLTAGYYSKDAIIESAYAGHVPYAFILLIIAALCTSFYSWRLAFMTFNGKPRADEKTMSHVHESPNVMLIPLYILAVGALFAGFMFKDYFIGHDEKLFWGTALYRAAGNHILHDMHEVPEWVKFSPIVMMALGFVIAYLFYIYNTAWPRRLAESNLPLYKFLLHKWYFDELYNLIFIRPTFWLGQFFWKRIDGQVIDGLGPNGVAHVVLDTTRGVVKLQTGYLYHYAFAMLIGVAALASWFTFGGAQ